MASRIEQVIEDIEDYIAGCKTQVLSSSNIIVNKDEIEALLSELRSKAPEEIKRYQRIISNKEAILADAQAKADAIIANAQVRTDELINEHQIMQQAYAQANEVVMIATKQAQEILDNATNDANQIRIGAMQYTDDILRNLEASLANAMDAAKINHNHYLSALKGFYNEVAANRAELNPSAQEQEVNQQEPEQAQNMPNLDITQNISE